MNIVTRALRIVATMPVSSASEAAAALNGVAYTSDPTWPKKDAVLASLQAVENLWGSDEVTFALQRFGCKSINDLWIGSYREFIKLCSDSIVSFLAPSASWPVRTVKNRPELPQARPLVEALVKRRAISWQLGFERQFDTALKLSKQALWLEPVDAEDLEAVAKKIKMFDDETALVVFAIAELVGGDVPL